jgi:cytoskeleton protein RodZ
MWTGRPRFPAKKGRWLGGRASGLAIQLTAPTAVLCSKIWQAEGGMSIGAQLRASREARGLSIDAIAHTTRVQARILAAIERDDVSGVPPRPFGRGFVRAYAREMGLDGDQTARDYFAQFAPVVPPPRVEAEQVHSRIAGVTRFWPFAAVSVGALAAIVLAVIANRPASTGASGAGVGNIVGTSGTTPSPAAAPPAKSTDVAADVAGVAPPKAAAPVSSAALTVVLTATDPCWVRADADGRRAVFRTVVPGSPETITANREIEIRVGNAGALALRINGREVGSMGRPGQVRDVRITPATAATIR